MKLGMSIDTVQRATEFLVRKHVLCIQRRGIPRRNWYQIQDAAYLDLCCYGTRRLEGEDNFEGRTESVESRIHSRDYTDTGDRKISPPSNKVYSKNRESNSIDKSILQQALPAKVRKILDDDNPHTLQQQHRAEREVKKLQVQVPLTLQPVVARWMQIGVAHHLGTKSYRDGVRALISVRRGTFYRDKRGYAQDAKPYDVPDILLALDRFDKKRNDSEYLPVNKKFIKSLSLASFFHSRFGGNGTHSGSSEFLQCLQSAPRLAAEQYPELTELVRVQYRGHKQEELSREAAAKAANKFHSYWNRRQIWLRKAGIGNEKQLVVRWLGMLASTRERWNVGYILAQGMEQEFEKHVTRMAV